MTEEMSVERKLLPSTNNKSTSKNAKNSDSSPGQCLSYNNRKNPKDASFFKERGSNRESFFNDFDSRCSSKNSKNSNKRGSRGGNGLGSHSEVRDGLASADVGSVFRPGSKKAGQNLDELLNFSFESPTSRNQRRSDFGRFHSFQKTHGPCYNKEQFLLANCQFVVKENFDYSAHLVDPDLLVDWDCIEEVRLLQSEPPSCPICLYPPVAAQITRCGHVFCWPCVLHYLALSDKQWRKCPICFESVYKNQLRSCRSDKPSGGRVGAGGACPVVEGARIALRLMRRERGSNCVAPASTWDRRRCGRAARLSDEHSEFAKLLIISKNETKNIVINREKGELKIFLDREKDAPESCFILEALETLKIREAALFNVVHTNPSSVTSHFDKKVKQEEIGRPKTIFEDAFNDVGRNSIDETKVIRENFMQNQNFGETTEIFGSEAPHVDKARPGCVPKKYFRENSAEKSYYFYQAENGRLIFMHPLNVHCLIREYGSLEKAPDTVAGLVVQMETYTMCPEVRKHYRYLGHLPSTSVFSLIEIEFDPDQAIVSLETLSHFSIDFSKRHFARQKKAQTEQQQQKRCQRWEKAMLLNSANTSYALMDNESDDFPISTFVQSAQHEIQASLFSSLSIDQQDAHASTNEEISGLTRRIDVSPGSSVKSNESNQILVDMDKTPSFAQMLKCGKPKTLHYAPKNSVEFSEHRTTLEDEYAPSALKNYRHEFGDALQAAFDSLKSPENESVNKDEKSAKANKKNKKGKILFTL